MRFFFCAVSVGAVLQTEVIKENREVCLWCPTVQASGDDVVCGTWTSCTENLARLRPE